MPFRTLAVIALGLALLYGVFTIGSPFVLALVLVIAVEPLIQLLIRSGMKRLPAASIVCSLFVLLLMFLTYLLGLKVVTEVGQFALKAPLYLNDANLYVEEATQRLYDALPTHMAEMLQEWLAGGFTTLTDTLKGLITGFSSYLVNVAKTIPSLFVYLIVFVMAFYLFAFSLPQLKASFLSLFVEGSRERMEQVLNTLRSAVFGFLMAQVILSVVTYIITLVGLVFIGVDFPLAIALLICIVDILPVLGTGSVLVPWAAYSIVTGNLYLGTGLLILFGVITLVRRVLEPKVLGDAVGINALAALISIYVGFKIAGVIGLILGPVVVIIYQAMKKVGFLKMKIKLD